jgi:ribosomal protein L13
MKISKRFTDSVKMADGSLKCFTTEIQGEEITVTNAEELILASDKLFAQVKWLVERDQEKVFGVQGE